MATEEFTPTGDSPRAADDSDGIKGAIAAAMAEHEEAEVEQDDADTDEQPNGQKPVVEGDKQPGETKKPETGDEKKPESEAKTPGDKKPDDKKLETEGDKATEPPTSWSAKDKDTFKALPKAGQEFLLERHRSMEADYTRKTQEISALRKDYEAVDAIFTPQRDKLKQANLTPSQVIQGWANAEQLLMSGKGADFLPGVAKAYKIDPIKLATNILIAGGVADPKAAMEQIATAAADQIKAQPQSIQLPPEVVQRLAKVDQVAAHFEHQQRQTADAEVTRINTELDKFKTATDEKGALLHPHFEELTETMSQLVDRAIATKQAVPPIEQLYQDAIFANPAVRQKWLDGRLAAERSTTESAQRTAAEKSATEARAKSEKARKAGSSVTGSSGSGQPLNGRSRDSGNLRSTIAAAVEDQDQVVH